MSPVLVVKLSSDTGFCASSAYDTHTSPLPHWPSPVHAACGVSWQMPSAPGMLRGTTTGPPPAASAANAPAS